MAKYAVIRLSGKQYKVSEGEEVLVDKLADPKASAEVLMVVDGDKVKVGKPLVKDSKVEFKVLNEEEKGVKIDVYKFKAKSRYKKHIGFRPKHTRILVEKVSI
jgi:large subunit ribosomal protein L21